MRFHNEANEANYLEEGMAVYFSELITTRETGDPDYCKNEAAKHSEYQKAYKFYKDLIAIDGNAVLKLREVQPVIAWIQPKDFGTAKIDAPEDLINGLLAKFNYGTI